MVSQRTFSTEDARRVGDRLGINWTKVDIEQFRMGMEVELEHGVRNVVTNVTNDDVLLTGKIALAHLNEFRDYYTRLQKMEDEAKASL
ncbi:MAG TPA: hypothetical protein PK948_01765 [Gemmatimonadales bacterium]|jgi:hypothetical protein|nr:hypothetical protein [Gemmatimonadales bacterium]